MEEREQEFGSLGAGEPGTEFAGLFYGLFSSEFGSLLPELQSRQQSRSRAGQSPDLPAVLFPD